jgi:drug/metabolite transporter (DMT)-like permease
LFEAAVALALFGAIPVVIKAISANAFTIGIFRLVVATIGAIVYCAWKRQMAIAWRDVGRLALLGAIFFAHWITYFIAIKISSASIAAIGLSTYGIQLLILGALTKTTPGTSRLHRTDLVAVMLAVAGALVIVPDLTLRSSVLSGIALASLSALFYATLPILHQRFAAIPSSTRTLGQFAGALVLFLLFLPLSNWQLTGRDWGGLWFLGIGSTLIAHTLWVRVTTTLTPAAASVLYYGNLPFALLLSAFLLHEPFTTRTVVGALLIIGGGAIGLVSQARRNALRIVEEAV